MPRKEVEKGRVLLPGIPDFERCDNKVVSARYKPWSFVFVVRAQREDSRFCRFRPEIISHTHSHGLENRPRSSNFVDSRTCTFCSLESSWQSGGTLNFSNLLFRPGQLSVLWVWSFRSLCSWKEMPTTSATKMMKKPTTRNVSSSNEWRTSRRILTACELRRSSRAEMWSSI